jgi:Na+-transporting NADH:ubiquinone oxidoreductase subunit NqrF
MTRIQVIDRGGRTHSVVLEAGLSLMEALRDAGLPIAAICGGATSTSRMRRTSQVHTKMKSSCWRSQGISGTEHRGSAVKSGLTNFRKS